MDSTEISKIIFKGPVDAVKRYRWKAIGQLRLLDEFMHFQGLKQHKRRIVFPNGVVINCLSSFGLRVAEIQVPKISTVSKEEKITIVSSYLLIVYGNPEEYIDINYALNSPVFIPENVVCTEGSGVISFVQGTRLFGTYTMCWEAMVNGEDSFATANITEAIEQHFLRLYEKQEIVDSGLIPFTAEADEDFSLNSSLEIQPLSDVPAHGDPRIGHSWTKTLGHFNVTAFSFYNEGDYGLGTKKWAVSASLKDKTISWLGMDYYPPMGFMREICKQATCDVADSWIDVHIGFDTWSEINETTGAEEYYIGLMADAEATFSIWKLNTETMTMELQFQYSSTIREDKFEESFHPLRHVRVLGYGHIGNGNTVYWGAPEYSEGYYEEDLESGSIGKHSTNGTLVTAVWNPITRKIHIVTDDTKTEGDPSYSVSSKKSTTEYSHYGTPVSVGEFCYGYSTYWPAGSCSTFEYKPIGFPESVTCYDGYCIPLSGHGSDCWSGCGTIARLSERTKVSFGNFTIDGNAFSKGSTYSVNNTRRNLTPRTHGGSCGGPIVLDELTESTYQCEPSSRRDYEFLGGVFSPNSGIAYEYRSVGYEEKEFCDPANQGPADDPNTGCFRECARTNGDCPSNCGAYSYNTMYYDCLCAEYNWVYGDSGGNEKDAIDSAFPYDHNWRAILLEGTGRISENESELMTTPKTGMVIYQKEDGTLFLMGGGFATTDLGIYERGFFKQIEVKQEIEV